MLFQAAALMILLVFYGCYFGKMINQRRRGIQTDQIGKGKKGLVLLIEALMKCATILTAAAVVISICLNTTCLPDGVRALGMALAVLGTGVFICSVVTMRDSWRAGVPETDKTELVTDGIYQFSRNPAFLGFDLVYVGMLMMFFNWILFGLSVFAVLMLHLQIVNVEEDFLIAAFGEDYLNYRKKVNRYIGRKVR